MVQGFAKASHTLAASGVSDQGTKVPEWDSEETALTSSEEAAFENPITPRVGGLGVLKQHVAAESEQHGVPLRRNRLFIHAARRQKTRGVHTAQAIRSASSFTRFHPRQGNLASENECLMLFISNGGHKLLWVINDMTNAASCYKVHILHSPFPVSKVSLKYFATLKTLTLHTKIVHFFPNAKLLKSCKISDLRTLDVLYLWGSSQYSFWPAPQ